MGCIRRRGFLAAAIALLVAPVGAHARGSTAIARIGWLAVGGPGGGEGKRLLEALRRGLRELGYTEGRNVAFEFRWADNHADRLPALAAEVINAGVQVVVTPEPPSTLAAMAATRTTPIVARFASDPVEAGWAASLARPGGNVTGVTSISIELCGKRVELLQEALPSARRLGVLVTARAPGTPRALAETQSAARRLGLNVQVFDVDTANSIDQAIRSAREAGVDALIPLRNPLFVQNRQRLATLANRAGLPAIYDERAFAAAGGLMSFGANLDDLMRRAAAQVVKILNGAGPGEIPIEEPTTFELVINLKTAKALGLAIPQAVLLRANEIIQ